MQYHVNQIGLGAVSAQSLVPTPGAGWKIVVTGFSVSVGAAAANVLLSFSSSNQKQWRLPANGHVESGLMRWEGDANTALTITTSANGPTDVSIDYTLEQSGS